MVTPVVWNKPDIENSVPLWIIILAILAGLLLLALLIYVLYKVSEIRVLKFLYNVILLNERVIKTEMKLIRSVHISNLRFFSPEKRSL